MAEHCAGLTCTAPRDLWGFAQMAGERGWYVARTEPGRGDSRKMSRLRCARLLSLVIVAALPLGVLAPACSSTSTSTKGQLISCTDTGTGITSCHAVETTTTGSGSGSGSGSGTCEDVDQDGDGSPHDVGEDHHDPKTGAATDPGQAGSDDDDDDDHDGVPNERDCDRRHGGDDDGEDHDGGDHDGSGDHGGGGSDDG